MAFKKLTGGAWTAANFAGTLPTGGDDVGISKLGAVVSMPGDNGDVKLGTLHLHSAMDKAFGQSASPIKLGAAILKMYSGYPCYFTCDHPSTASHTTDDVRIQAANPGVVIELASITDGSYQGKFKLVDLARGKLTLKDTIKFDTSGSGAAVNVGFISNPGADSQLTIAETAPTLPSLRMNGGRGTTNNVVTEAVLSNGAVLTHDKAAIVTADIGAGCVLNYDHEAISGDGTVIRVRAGGTLNLLNVVAAKTLTKVRAELGSYVIWDSSFQDITTFEDLRRETRVV